MFGYCDKCNCTGEVDCYFNGNEEYWVCEPCSKGLNPTEDEEDENG